MRINLIWIGVTLAICVPLGIALNSPLLAWRDPIYIFAGIAGVVGLALLLVQPLLIGGYLVRRSAQSRVHLWVGICLVLTILIHVGGLWLTSPPDVIDALLFRSPTPFSHWGVIAMWAIFVTGVLAAFRLRLGLRRWRIAHTSLAIVIVSSSVAHAVLIQGTMGMVSKMILSFLVVGVTAKVVADRRAWTVLRRR